MQDIWFISCICFILLAITEYAACLYLKRNLTRKKRKAKMKLVKELVAKASQEEEDHLRQKEEQKLFVVRTFANNVVSVEKVDQDFPELHTNTHYGLLGTPL